MDRSKLAIAERYGSRPEVDVAKSELDAAGIPSMIQADTAGGMREHLAWSGFGFKLLVREEDLEAAREVLAPPAAGEELPDAELPPEGDGSSNWRRFT
jgi:F420-dependent methylenetetrahydromethanopterin dehydrogenase